MTETHFNTSKPAMTAFILTPTNFLMLVRTCIYIPAQQKTLGADLLQVRSVPEELTGKPNLTQNTHADAL